jgi:hypothetical protein
MDINAHFVRKVTAVANHAPSQDSAKVVSWIDLAIHEEHYSGKNESFVRLFTDGPNAALLADRYAAAINAVNAEIEQEKQAA